MKEPGQEDTQRDSGLWDREIDAPAEKPPHLRADRKVPRYKWMAGLAIVCVMLMFMIQLGGELVAEFRFISNLSAVNERARKLGGGVSNGRRAARYHVGIWLHGKDITDKAMPEIVAIVRECQARRLGGRHLSLDLSRTGVGDDGVKLLHGVSGLESVSVRETDVTSEGVRSLRKAMPRTFIEAEPIQMNHHSVIPGVGSWRTDASTCGPGSEAGPGPWSSGFAASRSGPSRELVRRAGPLRVEQREPEELLYGPGVAKLSPGARCP